MKLIELLTLQNPTQFICSIEIRFRTNRHCSLWFADEEARSSLSLD